MPHKLKYTNEDLLNRAREFYNKNKVPPRIHDFKAGFTVTVRKRFGNWNNFIASALNMRANYHNWMPEEIQDLLRCFWEKNKRFPNGTELTEDHRDIGDTIVRLWGTSNDFFESTIGISPRIEILRAIQGLTTNGCETATPAEIIEVIRRKIQFQTNLCSMNMRFLSSQGLVVGGRYDRTGWWKLTPKGKSFLIAFELKGQHRDGKS